MSNSLSVYYNEIDEFCCAWLSNLMDAGLITPGKIDQRSIEDVTPEELRAYDRCHFFAGIGIWDRALNQAGWSGPVWTGSCPCQPFSAAGKGGGFADERHLWPAFFHLIGPNKPVRILGEQVSSKDGLTWFDLVQTDLEGQNYSVGALDTCAAGVGAPHIRQRLYWVADSADARRDEARQHRSGPSPHAARLEQCGGAQRLEQSGCVGRERREASTPGNVDDGQGTGRPEGEHGAGVASSHWIHGDGTGPVNGLWRNADWLFCRDAKWRPVESETFPLANAGTYRNRVAELRGAGNAINLAQAQAFIEAVMEVLD